MQVCRYICVCVRENVRVQIACGEVQKCGSSCVECSINCVNFCVFNDNHGSQIPIVLCMYM